MKMKCNIAVKINTIFRFQDDDLDLESFGKKKKKKKRGGDVLEEDENKENGKCNLFLKP